MEYAFYFVTLGLGVGLLLYAGLLRLTQDVRLIPRSYGVKLKDPKAYARTVAHILCFLALALLTGAWVGFYAGPLFRDQGSGIRDQSTGFRVQGLEFRVQSSEFRVQSSEFRVQLRP